MKYLIALDLEGVAGVVGYPYEGLEKNTEQYELAVREAENEVNVITNKLFELGASEVVLWDNHGDGKNVSAANLDRRIKLAPSVGERFDRMSFARGYGFDGMLLVGYHSREGTIGGILAHTMSSKVFISHALNDKRIGEIEQDAYIAGEFDIPVLMVVSDDKGCAQAKAFLPDVACVATKTGLSRNKAILRDSEDVLAELKQKTAQAVSSGVKPVKLVFPSTLEVCYSRTEDAEKALACFSSLTPNAACYTVDARTVKYTLSDIRSFEIAMWGI